MKPMQTEFFDATADCGVSWVLAVNSKRGIEFATKQAALFARNYMLKHSLKGDVTLVSRVDGRSFKMESLVAAL